MKKKDLLPYLPWLTLTALTAIISHYDVSTEKMAIGEWGSCKGVVVPGANGEPTAWIV